MPEGPEVKTMMLYLNQELKGRSLTALEVCRKNYHKKTKGLDLLKGNEVIVECQSKGKCGWIRLDSGLNIVIGFGMTGGIRRGDKDTKHHAVRFLYDGGEIFFTDSRNFGHVWVMDAAQFTKKLSDLGPCILDSTVVDKTTLVSRLRRRNKKTVCEALMDQGIISGIGNYIKAEILYKGRVHPLSKVCDLNDDKLYDLYLNARSLAEKVLHVGGTTLYTYKDINGDNTGGSAHLMVYGMSRDPEGHAVTKLKTPDGRTTHYVPELQTIGLAST